MLDIFLRFSFLVQLTGPMFPYTYDGQMKLETRKSNFMKT